MKTSVLALVLIVFTMIAQADTLMPPEERLIESSNGQYLLYVAPPGLAPFTISWDGVPSAEEKAHITLTQVGYATLFQRIEAKQAGSAVEQTGPNPIPLRNKRTLRAQWRQALDKKYAYAEFLVSDDGGHVVAINNVIGDDDENVVVIFNDAGRAVHQLTLSDFIPAERLRDVPSSMTSRFWYGKHHLEDGMLLLEVWDGGDLVPDEAHAGTYRYRTIKVVLATGTVIGGPKKVSAGSGSTERASGKVPGLD